MEQRNEREFSEKRRPLNQTMEWKAAYSMGNLGRCAIRRAKPYDLPRHRLLAGSQVRRFAGSQVRVYNVTRNQRDAKRLAKRRHNALLDKNKNAHY
ncbi:MULTISPECIES: hypothetical protein [unclassified Acidovorax]|uniref:hypothetical protein n=1 Tax=unclassified Acidovorax TaxID=2684926 RepID=UPI0028831DF8|nr:MULTISPECIES: hypothetical protein [unclassified Acidovorax]